jgi:hypothetical protein
MQLHYYTLLKHFYYNFYIKGLMDFKEIIEDVRTNLYFDVFAVTSMVKS